MPEEYQRLLEKFIDVTGVSNQTSAAQNEKLDRLNDGIETLNNNLTNGVMGRLSL